MADIRKLAILGSGPAGYSAAIYAARAGLHPLVITGVEFGGNITKSRHLENYPGFSSRIDGVFLTEEMRKQAEAFGAELLADTAVEVDFSASPFRIKCEGGASVLAETLVIATGTGPKKLGLPNEAKLVGRGVSYCATCDGFFFKGKTAFVVGGGNAAVYDALYLSTICDKVFVVHRRDLLRAEGLSQRRLFETPNISVMWDSVVSEIVEAEGAVAGIKVRNVKTGEVSEYPSSGLFVAIGARPNTDVFKGKLALDEFGYVHVEPGLSETSVPGVFAAGDVKNPRFRQAVIAAASGAQAAMEAGEYLAGRKRG